MRVKRERYRESCRGCRFSTVREEISDPRVVPLLETHRYDGRWNVPSGDVVWSSRVASTLGFRCEVDGKETRLERRCRFFVGDARLAEALRCAEDTSRQTQNET